MFWIKKSLETEEFLKLFKMQEELRIKVEMMAIDLQLHKQKLSKKAGLKSKDEEEEQTETNKNMKILLNPDGKYISGSV